MISERFDHLPPTLSNPEILVPGTLYPINRELIMESDNCFLYAIGKDPKGEFYIVEPKNRNEDNLIIHHRNRRREKLGDVVGRVDDIVDSIEPLQEDVDNPEGIDPMHRLSQEVTQRQWPLVARVLDPRRGLITPRYFLEVGLRGSIDDNGNKVDIFIDGLGNTSFGLFYVVEHSGPGSPSNGKYRQSENNTKYFKKRFGENLVVGSMCFFHIVIPGYGLFLKLGHAKSNGD